MSVENVLAAHLQGLEEDIVSYLQSVLEDMSPSERKSPQQLFDAISMFLMDSGFSGSEDDAMQKCRDMAISFGGSGSSAFVAEADNGNDDLPILLSAPVKMKNDMDVLAPKVSLLDMQINLDGDGENVFLAQQRSMPDDSAASKGTDRSNFIDPLDAKNIPMTQREVRRQRKANEQLHRLLRAEAMARAQAEAELAAARMAVSYQASRHQRKQSPFQLLLYSDIIVCILGHPSLSRSGQAAQYGRFARSFQSDASYRIWRLADGRLPCAHSGSSLWTHWQKRCG